MLLITTTALIPWETGEVGVLEDDEVEALLALFISSRMYEAFCIN
jgi:hypothetical protein